MHHVIEVILRPFVYLQVYLLRTFIHIISYLNAAAPPHSMKPMFAKLIPSTLSSHGGQIKLVFYTPKGYGSDAKKKYPVVINFHGGGFTIGDPEEDARWATHVVEEADTVVCSVGYRRAPVYPFPTAVEDGADAVLWVHKHADALGLDQDRIGVSGFSSGGNLAFTVPLKVQDTILRRNGFRPALENKYHAIVKLIIAWYPSTDFTRSRSQRRQTNPNPWYDVPMWFEKVFDAAYLYPSATIKSDSPYLSPGATSDEMLDYLPKDIAIYTCEFDELQEEGERFGKRLKALGRKVYHRKIEGVQHGWDKSPNVFTEDTKARDAYSEACGLIRHVFDSVQQ